MAEVGSKTPSPPPPPPVDISKSRGGVGKWKRMNKFKQSIRIASQERKIITKIKP
jgi:hypothetical protein